MFQTDRQTLVGVRSCASHDNLAAERSEECPDRLYTDKHGMEAHCATLMQFSVCRLVVSVVSVRPLLPL